MALPSLAAPARPFFKCSVAEWSVTVALFAALALMALRTLWIAWREDEALSHGPLLLMGALVLLWMRRPDLQQQEEGTQTQSGGLLLMLLSAGLHLLAVWADIAFLRPLSFMSLALGGLWLLMGGKIARVCAGPVGLVGFGIPWPTTLVSAISFPIQLISSAYAALFAGMLGLNIERHGVHLTVLSEEGNKPIYSILVAQECSGLTSLMVLLAFGYLIAYWSPVRWWARAGLVLAVVPLTLLANAIRLTFILLAGGWHSASLAQWVHDHEQPVLVFLCSMGLLGLRAVFLAWPTASSASPSVAPATADVNQSGELMEAANV
jgi:exosortase